MRSTKIRAALYAAFDLADRVADVECKLMLSPDAFAGMLLRKAPYNEVVRAIAMVPREGRFYIRAADALQALYDAERAEKRAPKLKLLSGGKR